MLAKIPLKTLQLLLLQQQAAGICSNTQLRERTSLLVSTVKEKHLEPLRLDVRKTRDASRDVASFFLLQVADSGYFFQVASSARRKKLVANLKPDSLLLCLEKYCMCVVSIGMKHDILK